MKVLVVALACFVSAALAGLTPEQREAFDMITEGCIKETGVEMAVLEKFKNTRVYEADEKFNCFGACGLKAAGIMKASGAINNKIFTTTLKRALPAQIVEELKLCVSKVGKDACETGGLYLDCMKDKTAMTLI